MKIILVCVVLLYIVGCFASILYYTTDYEWDHEDCKFCDVDIPLTTLSARKSVVWPIVVGWVIVKGFYRSTVYSVNWSIEFIKLLIGDIRK